MSTIPITVVDNFLPNPQLWIELSESCKYHRSDTGNWPGERSDPIELICPTAFNILSNRFFSIFYSLDKENIHWKVSARFQKIESDSGEGWIHYDKSIVSGIVYLSKTSKLDAGTALYMPKNLSGLLNTDKKVESIKLNKLDFNKEYRDENNNNFIETVRVSNIFNRLVAFDCNVPHRALHFNNPEPRLTIVFFVEKLLCEGTPLNRMNRVVDA